MKGSITLGTEHSEASDTGWARNDYWLVCSTCLWNGTAYAGELGVEFPADVLLTNNLAYHRHCGGVLKVFSA